MKSGISLYLRVFLPFSATLVIAMLVAWWAASGLLAGALENRVHNQITHAAEIIAQGTFPFTRDLLVQIGALQNAHFALLRADGTIGLATFSESEWSTLAGIVEFGRTHPQQKFTEDHAIVIAPFASGRASEYTHVAGLASLTVVQSAARRTALILGLLTLAGVAVVAWWGHRLSSAVTRPIRELADMARSIAGGGREPISVPRKVRPGVREIAELAQALDDMTTRLGDYERDLLRANRLASLGEITSRVAHEIRNPLTAIKLQLQLLEERLDGHDEAVLAGRLLAEIQRLELIVASTVAIGRPQVIETRLENLSTVVEDVITLIGPQFEHLRIELQPRLETIAPIAIDSARLKQVLFNLLTNATDAMPAGGTVRITTTRDQAQVLLQVEDSGPGFPKEFRTADLFAAGDFGTTSTKPNGLGLGLVVCREIIELHGGTIAIDRSPSLGGARFTIHLPVQDG
ncbi:MAG: HAMP domain-containing sensor histidine kinase [Pseudomonadales bacterium]